MLTVARWRWPGGGSVTCTCGCTAAVAAADAGIGLAGNEAEGNPGDSGIAGSKPEEIKSQNKEC